MQGTQLMRSAAEGDSALLLGGDLIITVHRAEQLCGQERLTHPFARVCACQIVNVCLQQSLTLRGGDMSASPEKMPPNPMIQTVNSYLLPGQPGVSVYV